MKPPASRRPRPADWRRLLPSAGAASKALALAATLAFVTVVGLRAGPAASAPAVAAPSAPAAPAPSAPRPPEAAGAARAPEAPVAPHAAGAAASAPSAADGAEGAVGGASARGEEAAAGAGVLPDGRVVLNVASEQDLTRLPGIGPARAKAILALRLRLGRFRSLTDLRRVKGIGRRSLERLRPHAVLDAPS